MRSQNQGVWLITALAPSTLSKRDSSTLYRARNGTLGSIWPYEVHYILEPCRKMGLFYRPYIWPHSLPGHLTPPSSGPPYWCCPTLVRAPGMSGRKRYTYPRIPRRVELRSSLGARAAVEPPTFHSSTWGVSCPELERTPPSHKWSPFASSVLGFSLSLCPSKLPFLSCLSGSLNPYLGLLFFPFS